MFQAFNFLIFLGSKKYLLPQFLTLIRSQVRMSFILASVEDRNGIIIEDDFQKKKNNEISFSCLPFSFL